jgi:nucleoside-diphosphate-sugar epimerase
MYSQPESPARVVVLGSGGFIGAAITQSLRTAGISTLALSRVEMDLLSPTATDKLTNLLNPSDVLVLASANAPCKDLAMLQGNLAMIEPVCVALQRQPVAQVVYISSDAVYKDSTSPLTEESCAEPNSLHGVMHLAREVALRQAYTGPLALVRPTLVYGLNDPHNGYGPNRFRRLAAQGQDIVLYGEGEERRDHVDVEDVADLVLHIVLQRSAGIANAVSGQVVSFRELAEFAASAFLPQVTVQGSTRKGVMPHNGYRAFDNRALCAALPGLHFRNWQEGLTQVHQQQVAGEAS